MIKRLFAKFRLSSEKKPLIFDEKNLTDNEWVEWKRRCAKHLGVNLEDPDEIILASRKRPETSNPTRGKES